MRVLVFDDDDAICRLVVKVCTMSGMEAIAVNSAEAFAAHLKGDPPEVVVLDMQLGDTDGVEQMRLLADQHYAGALVLMSGYDARVLATARMVGRSLGLKLERVLEKPLRVVELEQVLERLRSENQSMSADRLLKAITNDELLLDFQPVVSRTPKSLKKLEALVRWDHPVLGRIPPGEFLPVAESDVATVDALTEWIVGAAVEAYQVLAQLGVSVPLAVNISMQNLHDLTLPDRLAHRLQNGGMPAEHLCIEITESAAFRDPVHTMDILSRMRLKGMQLSIDDFGTGYSSLKMLRQLPFTEIKIDRSFVMDMAISRDSRAIVKSIIDLSANMEMGCVAEGVDTEEAAKLLEAMGVSDLQGFLIAPPMPVESVPAWLAIWTQSASGMLRGEPIGLAPDRAAARGREAVSLALSVHPAVDPKNDVVQLTPRQLEVMRLLSEGCAVKEIAYRMKLGISTVKVHLSLAYSALGSHNRIEAIRRAGPALLNAQAEKKPST